MGTVPVGPLVAAGMGLIQFFVNMFLGGPDAKPKVDPLQQALRAAESDLSNYLHVTVALSDTLTNYLDTQMKDDLSSSKEQKLLVYRNLTDAVKPGAADGIPARLTNMEMVMKAENSKWRERHEILAAYIVSVGVELLIYNQLILVDAMVGNVPNALKSGFVQDLADVSKARSDTLTSIISSTADLIVSDYSASGYEFAASQLSGTVETMVSTMDMMKGVRVMAGPLFDPPDDWTDAIRNLDQASKTAAKWLSQAQGWAAAVPAGQS